MIRSKSTTLPDTAAALKVVIIGGGFSGLATAALLAKDGYQVTVIEKNAELGGRASVLKKNGFTFDRGPSWYLMPEVFEKYFQLFGKKPSDYYQLLKLNPRYQVFFGGDRKEDQVLLSDDNEVNAAWFEQQEVGAGNKFKKYLSKMGRVYHLATQDLLYANVNSWRSLVNLKNVVSGIQLAATIQFWRSWYREVSNYFTSERLKQILSFSAVFLGGSPFNTPALYSMLAWADFGEGVWYPQGGFGQVVNGLVSLSIEYGVQLKTSEEAIQIEVNEDGSAIGVRTKTAFWPADVVVAATDLALVETRLLTPKFQTYDAKYWESRTLGISALLLYLGVDHKLEKVIHHNMYFSKDWQKNFQEIFQEKKLPTDPSFYMSIRSASDPSIVPKNCEEIFVLVPLGAGTKYKAAELDQYADKIIAKIESLLDTKFTKDLVVKEIFGPQDFAAYFNAFQGTALGLAHTLGQSLWFRPGNQSHKVANLYYAGQYTNPGVGVPMAFISAQIVSQLINQKYSPNEQIFKNGSKTYYYASIFFRGQIKKDVFALYAYVRMIDDLVDLIKPKIAEFEDYWQETQVAWKAGSCQNQIVSGFVRLAKRKNFEWKWIQAFWDSMRCDLTKKYYSNADLDKYIYGSAEVIGLMMAKILELPDQASQAAQLQGKAMQLINFIRDVAEDEELGRNYLGYSEREKNDSELWSKKVRQQIEKYREIQTEAKKGWQFIPRKYLIPIKTAADMYNWTAQEIFANPAIVWKQKMKPQKRQVIKQLIWNFLTVN